MRAVDAVTDEDRSHDIDQTERFTNGELRGEPARPTAAEIAAAYGEQANEIDAFLRQRRLASP